jgi:hypothetical protein
MPSAGICNKHDIPWVLLSGGAAHDKFERVLEYAYAAGAGGFLAGRTIWLNAVRTHFSGSCDSLGRFEQRKRRHLEQSQQVNEGAGAFVGARRLRRCVRRFKQISLTDPDARSMATSRGGSGMVGYNVRRHQESSHCYR